MKKLLKVLPILMTVMMVFMTVTPVFASVGGLNINISSTPQGSEGFVSVGQNILSIIRIVGTIIAVGVLMVLGIKYMMGSAEEKAEYKKTMIPYIVGAIILFAAVQIAGAVVNIASNITAQATTPAAK